jgi:acetyl-CoA carboxylase biotin carboxyl carrier protein
MTGTKTPREDIPVEVTMREVKELLRTFESAGWASLDVTLGDMHIVLGRDGAPTTSPQAPPVTVATVSTLDAPQASAPVVPNVVVSPGPTTPTTSVPELLVTAKAAPSATAVEVRSPVVGTFWLSPGPGQPPFVEVGQTVAAGQQLGIVEVMKLMSDISSPVAGTVAQILAVNASMVEYDHVLVLIEPSDD